MPKLAALLLPLLLLACRPPATHAQPPPSPSPRRPGPARLEVEVAAVPGVQEPEALRREILAELGSRFADWNPVEIPAGTPRTPTVPRLRVTVKQYQVRPAGSPFAAVGLPGVASMGAGAAILQAGAGAQELGALPYVLFGGSFLGLGLAALTVGIALESRKSYLDRRRGYPLHAFKAQVVILWPWDGGEKQEQENYRAVNLGSEARPLAPGDAADPAKVRREMMRALALAIREDVEKKTGWGRPLDD